MESAKQIYTEIRNKVIKPHTVWHSRPDLSIHAHYSKDLDTRILKKTLFHLLCLKLSNTRYLEKIFFRTENNLSLKYIHYQATALAVIQLLLSNLPPHFYFSQPTNSISAST